MKEETGKKENQEQTKHVKVLNAADKEKEAKKRAAAKRKSERKERRESRRHRVIFKILDIFTSKIFKRILHYSCDTLKDVEGPYLLLANHNMEMDPIMVGIATKKQIYFVASEHIMRKGFKTWLLRFCFRPILITKGKNGTKSVMEIMKTMKRGNNVCLFAEGNRSFNGVTGDILPSTGKLAKAAGASLVTFRFEGGYLSQPRFSTSRRKGQIYGHLVNVYKPEQLKQMSEDEMNEAINRDLYEDAYKTQDEKMIPYEGKNLTEGIESTLFYCPSCKSFNSLKSTKDEVSCTCGFKASYNRFGYLECSDDVTRNMRDWDAEQQTALQQAMTDGTLPAFTDEVTVREIDNNHKICREESGTLTVDGKGVTFAGREYAFSDFDGIAIFSRNFMNAIVGAEERQFDIRGDIRFCALKYLYYYQMLRKESES